MINLSFNERFSVLSGLFNNDILVYVLPGSFLFMIALIVLALKGGKVSKIILSILGFGIIGFMGYYFQNPILSFLDYFMDVVVNNILFPNLALYIFSILVIDIALIISLLSNSVSKFTKAFNVIIFTVMQLFLFFIVNVIITNNINVYEALSIYTNKELLVLVETSMVVFALWIVLLGMFKITTKLTSKKTVKETVKVKNNNRLVLDYNDIMDENGLIEYIPIKKKRV